MPFAGGGLEALVIGRRHADLPNEKAEKPETPWNRVGGQESAASSKAGKPL